MYLVYLEEGRIHSVFGVSRDPDLCIYHLGSACWFAAAARISAFSAGVSGVSGEAGPVVMIVSTTWAVWWATCSAAEDVCAAARDALAADDMMREGASVTVPDAVMAAAEAAAVWAVAACVSECGVAVGTVGGASTGCTAEAAVRSAGGSALGVRNTGFPSVVHRRHVMVSYVVYDIHLGS